MESNKKERAFIGNVLKQLEKAGEHNLENKPIGSEENIFDYLNYHVIKTFLDQEYFRVKAEVLEYRTLQMQINPHFLFNTLDTIYWKAIGLNGENEVSLMIILLPKILKYSLELHDKDGVSLDDEVAITQYYIQLQHYRFKNRFEVNWNIDPALSGVHVPSLLFQPILENAFNHGFRENAILHITLFFHKEGDDILFLIGNDGKKIRLETLAQLNDPQTGIPCNSSSIGIINVKKRIELFYQGKATLTVGSSQNTGTQITIRIKP
ncbi:MAG: histidine kinase [Sphaerochaetaceae bacterium]